MKRGMNFLKEEVIHISCSSSFKTSDRPEDPREAYARWSVAMAIRNATSYGHRWIRHIDPFLLYRQTASALKLEVDMVDPNKQDLQPAKSQEQLKFRTAAIYHKVPSVCASMAKFKSILTIPYRNILYNLHKSPKTEKIVWDNGHISNSRKI